MSEEQVISLLEQAADVEVAPVDVGRLVARGRARRNRSRVGAVGFAGAVVIAGVYVGPSLRPADQSDRGVDPATSLSSADPAPSTGACLASPPVRLVPTWARGGFSGEEPRVPLVMGDRGRIVAILFGGQLNSPPAEDRANKILWVGNPSAPSTADTTSTADLRITAVLDGGERTVRREVAGGPGPSLIDLPATGCWRLTLRWADRVDTMSLRYVAP